MFHRDASNELYVILTAWALIVALDPIESLLQFFSWMRDRFERVEPSILGAVAAHHALGLVLIRQTDDVRYQSGTLMALSDDQGPTMPGFAFLTPCEISALFSHAALKACQSMGMINKARTCLVYEEAHSLVPEWNSVASDGDKNATAASARAILQGRKFGLGCLLVTQRTANVTKTILNQCNSIFAMRTFDDTGKDFLGNYIGSDYARVLPSLQERHAVFFGKASSCDDPVLIRLNDRDKFVEAFREAEDEVQSGDSND